MVEGLLRLELDGAAKLDLAEGGVPVLANGDPAEDDVSFGDARIDAFGLLGKYFGLAEVFRGVGHAAEAQVGGGHAGVGLGKVRVVLDGLHVAGDGAVEIGDGLAGSLLAGPEIVAVGIGVLGGSDGRQRGLVDLEFGDEVALDFVADHNQIVKRTGVVERGEVGCVAGADEFKLERVVSVVDGQGAEDEAVEMHGFGEGPEAGVVLLDVVEGVGGAQVESRDAAESFREIGTEACLKLLGLRGLGLEGDDADGQLARDCRVMPDDDKYEGQYGRDGDEKREGKGSRGAAKPEIKTGEQVGKWGYILPGCANLALGGGRACVRRGGWGLVGARGDWGGGVGERDEIGSSLGLRRTA